MSTESDVVAELLERIRVDHVAWVNGDSSGYEFEDETSTILGAFGGAVVGASIATPGQRRVVTLFESGTGSVELLNSGVSGDVAWNGFGYTGRPTHWSIATRSATCSASCRSRLAKHIPRVFRGPSGCSSRCEHHGDRIANL